MLVQMAFMFLLMQQQMALAMCLSYLLLESISQFKPHTSSTSTVPPHPRYPSQWRVALQGWVAAWWHGHDG